MKYLILFIMLVPSMAFAFEAAELASYSFWAPYLPLVIMLVEYVLGKTDWVEANSVVDLILRGLVKLVKKDKKV